MARASATAKIADPLRVYLLGTFRIERGHQTVHFPTRKVESLFAYLALHPEPHLREKLAGLLWGDSTDEQARHSLRTALAAIRKEVGDALFADRETIQLDTDFRLWTDAREFKRLASNDPQSMIELYGGDLLPDFYDDWIPPEREHFRKIYLDALLQLAQQHREKSEYTRAIEFAQRVLATDPANEKAYQHIIFCLAATGDRIGALKQYDECEKKLRDELGVEPSKETAALRDQIEQALTGGKAREALFTNVPTPLTSFVGRAKELAELRGLVGQTRLLTLTGAGGCGKTRLAIEFATELANANRFKNGAWWVELAPLADPTLVPRTVATVFDLDELPNVPILTVLTNYLRAKELLLVLDNCEHLIDACAKLADVLLHACPHLKILASSREALGIVGELPYRIPSLSLPPPESNRDWNLINQSEAVQLYVARTQPLATSFTLNKNNAPTVAQICTRLDGIPLALELAAARVKTLSVEQIAARLDDRFRLLAGGSRTELPRHQTLRAATDWSYDLLSEAEGAAFRQLSVFAGGWTLEAAEAVVSPNALDLLAALADKSLVVVEQKETATRYRFLETIRQYAREKLQVSGELQLAQDRHLDYFLKLAEEAQPHLLPGDPSWLDRLETENDNLRAALEHSLTANLELALRLAMSLEWFWTWHNRVKEGYGWVTRLLPLTEAWGPGKLRARVLGLAGGIALDVPDRKAASAFLQTSLEMARAAGDKYQIAWSLYDLAVQSLRSGKWEQMRAYTKESLPIFEELGIAWGVSGAFWQLGRAAYGSGEYETARSLFEQCLESGRKNDDKCNMTFALNSLGNLARLRGDYASAKALYTESTQIIRQMGHKVRLAMSLANLGQVALHDGDPVRAKALFEESLAIYRHLEDAEGQVDSLAGFAEIASVAGRHQLAARLFGAAEAAYETLSSRMSPLFRAECDPIVDKLRKQLDRETFDAAWQAGRKLTLEQAIQYALENVK